MPLRAVGLTWPYPVVAVLVHNTVEDGLKILQRMVVGWSVSLVLPHGLVEGWMKGVLMREQLEA